MRYKRIFFFLLQIRWKVKTKPILFPVPDIERNSCGSKFVQEHENSHVLMLGEKNTNKPMV